MVPEFYLLSIQLLNFLWILTFSALSHPFDNFEFHFIFLYSFVTYTFVENGPRILTNLDPSPQLWLILTFFWFDAWILPTLNLLMILTFTFFFSIDISECSFIENGPKFIPIFPNFLIYFDFPFLFSYLFLTFTVFENGPRIQLILHPSPQPSDWFWLSLALFSLSLSLQIVPWLYILSVYLLNLVIDVFTFIVFLLSKLFWLPFVSL